MHIVCLDLEGVLVPEIWINVSAITGIEKLKLTTRDIPDYHVLMQGRIDILKENGLKLKDIQDVISNIRPLDGAREFFDELRSLTQVIILSDTFEEFASPLMKMLGYPTIFCNSLKLEEGSISGIRMRIEDGKRKSVEALKAIGFKTFAAGDSYNDLSMIKSADDGCLFRAPSNIIKENPNLDNVEKYDDFLRRIRTFLEK